MLGLSKYAEYLSNFPYTQLDKFAGSNGPFFDVNALQNDLRILYEFQFFRELPIGDILKNVNSDP